MQLRDAKQLAGIHTGMHIEVSGRWQQAAAAAGGMQAAAAGAGPAAGSSSFQAATIRHASGAAFAAPKVANAAGQMMAAAAAATTTPAVALSTNQLITSAVNTIVVPSKSLGWLPGCVCSAPGSRQRSIHAVFACHTLHRGPAPLLMPPPRPCPSRCLAVAGMADSTTACPGTALPKFSVDDVKKAVFAESNPSSPTVGSTFNKCSYGKTKLTTANSRVADLVQLPCNGIT